MIVYRVCSASHTALSGTGSHKFGGRWNSPGIAVNYTAGTAALAILETRVHLRRPPIDYVLLTIKIGDKFVNAALTTKIGEADLAATRAIGDTFFISSPKVPLRDPSVVAPHEYNFLFSAAYASKRAQIIATEPIDFDYRLWQ